MTRRDRFVGAVGVAAIFAIFGVSLLLDLPMYTPVIGLVVLWVVLMYAYRARRSAR